MNRLSKKVVLGWRLRSIAWALLLSFLLPLAQVAFGATSDPESILPVCCRSHGKHKCFMLLADSERSDTTKQAAFRSSQLSEKCPCAPATISAFGTHHPGLPSFRNLGLSDRSAEILRPLNSANLAVACSSAHQKRGPPSLSIFA